MKDVNHSEEIRRAMAKIFTRVGLRDVDANILAEIFIQGKEVSVKDLSRFTGYSISGITSSLHRLMKMHLVVRHKIGKMYVYSSESNILSALLHLIEDIQRHEIRNLINKINAKISDENENLKILKRKIMTANEYLSQIIEILGEYARGDWNESSFDM